MKRLLALLALVLFLWPAAAHAAVALCAISGQVFNPDGSTLNNGTVQFNSQVTQVVGSTTIPPSIISTTTDANGNMAPMSVAQGLFGTFTFCQGHSQTNVGGPGGGCAAAINGLIPINTTGNINAVIAGTLLPSVGNATVNNLTATNNVNVGALLETTTLKVDSNATVGGTLGVTGNTTLGGTLNVTGNTTLGGTLVTTGAMTAPALSLTSPNCSPSAVTLAGGVIASEPPNAGMNISSGAHCTGVSGSSTWTADQTSAVIFANYFNGSGGINNAGWQWTGNQGLTPGSIFTPTLLMSLTGNPLTAFGGPLTGILSTGSLILTSTNTALQLAGGSFVSAGVENVNMAMGTHYTGGGWIADSPMAAIFSEFNTGTVPAFQWSLNNGLTVGSAWTSIILGQATANGWTLNGTNPVAILQSNTNANADILQVVPQNGTQGVGMLWSGFHSIGTNPNVSMNIDSKGSGSLNLNTVNVGAAIYTSGPMAIQDNFHLGFMNNGGIPTLGTCSAGSMYGTSTDVVGQIGFTGSGATNCSMNFYRTWANTPLCVCNAVTVVGGAPSACVAQVSTTGVVFYFTGTMTNGYIDYHCLGAY